MSGVFRPIILASASPRRRALLESAGIPFRVEVAGVEEHESGTDPHSLAALNARAKASVIAARFPSEIVLAADTVVHMDGAFFGKPAGLDDARGMILRLAGKTHEVVTAVWIGDSRGPARAFTETTRVTFREATAIDIDAYLAEIHPFDKAGGYAAQEDNGRLIAGYEGLFSNIVGLPIERVREELLRIFESACE